MIVGLIILSIEIALSEIACKILSTLEITQPTSRIEGILKGLE
jgi:hypothetical protein